MASSSKIEWTEATWNPVTGCTKVSPGCDHCYAIPMARRIEGMQNGQPFRDKVSDYAGTTKHEYDAVGQPADVDWTGKVNLLADRLDWPIRKTKPLRIFVNSMSDLFHDAVPDDFIARVFAVMAIADHHQFQLLTKRHARMRSLLNKIEFAGAVATLVQEAGGIVNWPIPNVWVGVSVENQQWADIRIPALLDTPAAVRWLSCEPLLGAVDLEDVPVRVGGIPAVDWVVAGGESGPGARPMHPRWLRNLRNQCVEHDVPFLFKQWGAWAPGTNHRNYALSKNRWRYPSTRFNPAGEEYVATEPDHPTRGYSAPDMVTMLNVGKKTAGRELDGRTWDEYPKEATR